VARRRVPAPRQLRDRRREKPWPRLVGKRKRTTKQWATFAPLQKPRRASVHLRAFEEEVVLRKVRELHTWRERPVTGHELCAAFPGLFNERYLGAVLKRHRLVQCVSVCAKGDLGRSYIPKGTP
jgi:hypothetical protein